MRVVYICVDIIIKMNRSYSIECIIYDKLNNMYIVCTTYIYIYVYAHVYTYFYRQLIQIIYKLSVSNCKMMFHKIIQEQYIVNNLIRYYIYIYPIL